MSKSGVNRVTLVGNLGADPEANTLPSGSAVSNFNIATSESWTDKQTGELVENTEWHRIVVYGPQADPCNQYLAKGRKVYIEGKLRTRKWQTNDGQDRYTTEVVAQEVQFMDSRASVENGAQVQAQAPAPRQQAPAPQAQQRQAPPPPAPMDDFGDDVPFSNFEYRTLI